MEKADTRSRYRIIGFKEEGPLVRRLQDLGFQPGKEIKIQNRLMFGGAWVIRVGPTSFALRGSEFELLQLEKIPE